MWWWHWGGKSRQIFEFEASLVYRGEFQNSQDYTEKCCFITPPPTKGKKNNKNSKILN
jgi:hypothetical protein